MNNQDDLKNRLRNELEKNAPDLQIVAAITDKLLDLKEGAVRFSVDAQLINRLGYELVGKQETALSELIKNAYDADATKVEINFKDYNKLGGTLTIIDNGNGMNIDAIKQAWMRLSTTDKNKNPISPLYNRSRAGKKGIGRFAVQRLGKKLVLRTEVDGEDAGYEVTFDWDKDFIAGEDLANIWNEIKPYKKKTFSKGTTLRILGLRDKWTDATMERAWKSVLLLQPPFKTSNISQAATDSYSRGSNTDPGFQVIINGLSDQGELNKFSIQKNFLDHAIATITGYIDEDGYAHFSLNSEVLPAEERHISERRYLVVGPVYLEVRYFIYLRDAMPGTSTRQASEMGQRFGGVRLYRNGFRVFPYGERWDDWLRLGEDTGRRNLLVPANNFNFFGQVEIDRDKNPFLEETSSREGLIENEAYEELREFARKCVEWGVMRVAAIRKRKTTSAQTGFISVVRKPSEVISDVLSEVDESGDGGPRGQDLASDSENIRGILQSVQDSARAYEDQQSAKHENMVRYEEMLRILASLGLSIAVFGHEIAGVSNSVNKELELFNQELKSLDTQLQNRFEVRKKGIENAIHRVFDLGNYISHLISYTESRKLITVSVRGRISNFSGQFNEYMDKLGIVFKTKVTPPELRTCKMHPSELDSVLFNFLTNSIKALRRAKQKNPKVRIDAHEDGKFVVIRFEDNGIGVDDAHKDRIFDAFFTTTEQDFDDMAGPGMGLGLRIVSDIASSYGGDVKLVGPAKGYKSCFEFRILRDGGDRS